MENNRDVKLAARGAGVPLWRLAQALGVSEATVTRKLREPLEEKEKNRFMEIIGELRKGVNDRE